MADKTINQLTQATDLTDSSLFVIEQNSTAKQANWGMMKNYISPGVAAQYSTSATYNVGDYVIYNGSLYRCNTAITTGEAWTAAHWTAAVLSADVANISESLKYQNLLPVHGAKINTSRNGITYKWENETCIVSGLASSGSWDNIVSSSGTLPDYLETGKTYKFELNSTDSNIKAELLFYMGGSSYSKKTSDTLVFHISENITGITIRLYVGSGLSVNGNATPTMYEYNDTFEIVPALTYDFDYSLANGLKRPGSKNGVSFRWYDMQWYAYGTATDGAFQNIIDLSQGFDDYFKAGNTYQFIYDSTDSKIKVELITYKSGTYYSTKRINYDYIWHIPDDASGIIVRLYVASGDSVAGYISPKLYRCFPYAQPQASLKIANFGDSITWGRDGAGSASTQTQYTITNYLKKYGCYAENFGVGGMGYFSTGGGLTALGKLQSVDLSPYDIITLGFGTNDNSAVLGTVNDTDGTTMLGAMYKCWQYIRSQNSHCVVVFIAPPNASTFGQKASGYWYGYSRGPINDYTLTQLVEGMRSFCLKYNIPFIDNLHNGIDIENISTLLPDGVHPNDTGYKVYSNYISRRIINAVY